LRDIESDDKARIYRLGLKQANKLILGDIAAVQITDHDNQGQTAMIVCICNNVSDRAIRTAVDAGVKSMAQLRTQLEIGTCCGKCNSCARTILRESIEDQANRPVLFQPAVAGA